MTELIHAYAAGFFDGEGSIVFEKAGQQVYLRVWQNDPAPLQLLKTNYGGNIYPYQSKAPNRKLTHQWTLQRRADVVRTLEFWLPHLIVKRDKAIQALEHYTGHV